MYGTTRIHTDRGAREPFATRSSNTHSVQTANVREMQCKLVASLLSAVSILALALAAASFTHGGVHRVLHEHVRLARDRRALVTRGRVLPPGKPAKPQQRTCKSSELTYQKISLTFEGMSLMPSTGTHFLHLWQRPSTISVFSCFPGFARATVRKASGGEKGLPVSAEMPKKGQNIYTGAREEGKVPCAYCI